MLLNGLLRYRHPDFTNEMLDDIERFLVGLKKHPFQIPEKLAAIRTARLMASREKRAQQEIKGDSAMLSFVLTVRVVFPAARLRRAGCPVYSPKVRSRKA